MGPDPNYGMNRLVGILDEKYQVSNCVRKEVIEF